MKNIDEIKKEYFQWLEKAGEIEKNRFNYEKKTS